MLYQQIQEDLKAAMKARAEVEVSTLRMLWAAVNEKAFELRKSEPLTDEEVAAVIQKEIKQRRDSIEAYRAGSRPELVQKEETELKILSKYLPQQMAADQLEKIVNEAVEKTTAAGPADFGKVMGVVMAQVKGQADGNEVARLVKERLGR